MHHHEPKQFFFVGISRCGMFSKCKSRRTHPFMHSNTTHAEQKSGSSSLMNDPYITAIRQFSLMASLSHSVPPVSCMSSHSQVQPHSSSTSKKDSVGALKSLWAAVDILFTLVYSTEHRKLSFEFTISTPFVYMTYFGWRHTPVLCNRLHTSITSCRQYKTLYVSGQNRHSHILCPEAVKSRRRCVTLCPGDIAASAVFHNRKSATAGLSCRNTQCDHFPSDLRFVRVFFQHVFHLLKVHPIRTIPVDGAVPYSSPIVQVRWIQRLRSMPSATCHLFSQILEKFYWL